MARGRVICGAPEHQTTDSTGREPAARVKIDPLHGGSRGPDDVDDPIDITSSIAPQRPSMHHALVRRSAHASVGHPGRFHPVARGRTSGFRAQTAAFDAATASGLCEAFFGVSAGPEPLSACQWDMRYIEANASSRARATGDGVKVGVIDGGIDFTHPDLDNIDVGLSCSFIFSTTPTADPSEVANGDCSNKAAVQDLQGHGTHVATTIAGALDGTGIVGVAPDATIVGLKACTIIGFCFVDSVAAALRYAGDQHLDVVNLSLFADPYLYYCSNDAGQRAMYQEMKDAAKYASSVASSWSPPPATSCTISVTP